MKQQQTYKFIFHFGATSSIIIKYNFLILMQNQLTFTIFKIGFYLAIGITFLYNGITHTVLWYTLWLDRKRKQQRLLSYLRLLKSFVGECLFTFIKLALHLIYFLPPVRMRSIKKTSHLIDGTTAILFVHGYIHHQLAWIWFIYKLKKQIKNPNMPLFTLNLYPPFSSISKMAKLIKRKKSEIHKLTNCSKIILVGHSMGGILSSYYTEYLAKPGQVAKVITIGSPLRGTCIAKYGLGKNAKEMVPSSKFLYKLNRRIKCSKVAYFSVASKIDNLIIPWQSALLNNQISNNKFIVNDCGHLGLLMSDSVIKQVYRWIL